jgi:uncharacterized membrane protein HdeD (DUF308 family)
MVQREGNDPAEMLQTLGRSWGWVLFFGAVTLILGILVVIDPQTSVVFVAVLVGIEIVISGIFRLVASFTAEGEGHRIWWVLLGVLSIVVGVFLIRHLGVTLSILPIVVGIFWIIQGVMEFFAAIANPDMPSRGWTMVMGVLGLVAGIVVVSWPIQSIVTLAWVLGIWLAVYGLMTIVAAFQVKKFAGAVTARAA